MYKRFQALDKRHKGYISEDELLNIPELAINPLAPRIVQLFVNVNFKEFCRLLSLLSKNAKREDKIRFMFKVYDVDADGIVSRNDLEIILRQLVGSTLSEEKIDALVHKAMNEILEMPANANAKTKEDLGFDASREASSSSSQHPSSSSPQMRQRMSEDDDEKLPGLTQSTFERVFAANALLPTVSIIDEDE